MNSQQLWELARENLFAAQNQYNNGSKEMSEAIAAYASAYMLWLHENTLRSEGRV